MVKLTPEENRATRIAILMRIDHLENERKWARPSQEDFEKPVTATPIWLASMGLELRDLKEALSKLETE